MRPTAHLIITAILFFFLKLFVEQSYFILVAALSLTIMIDVVDHGIPILFLNNDLLNEVRNLLKRGEIRVAYNLYYSRRQDSFSGFALFHTPFFLIAITIIALYYKNVPLFLGVVIHLLCDISWEYYSRRTLNHNWGFKLKR